jgi:hypothetical protein
MAAHRGRLVFIAALALSAGLSGCAPTPASGDPATLRAQAKSALERWDAAVASGGASAFVPVGELTGQIGDWEESVGGNNKPALMSGVLEAVVPLPTDIPPAGTVRWQDGSTATVKLMSAAEALAAIKAGSVQPCPECKPLRIYSARLMSEPFQTSKGVADTPMWEFTIEGTAVLVTRVAVADAVVAAPPPWDANNSPVGISIQSAAISADGLTLKVLFIGAPGTADQSCGADYTAEAVESANAVVVIVTEHPHQSLFGESCTLAGAARTADARLASPLGGRAVLDVVRGQPVTVTPAG